MNNTPEQKRRVKSRRTLNGWILELDSQSWADVMSALSIAIDATSKDDSDRAATFRTLRSALSRAERG